MSTLVLQPCPLNLAILHSNVHPWQRWAAAHSVAAAKIVRRSCKPISFALSVHLCAYTGQAMSKCSVQELHTSARRLQVTSLPACKCQKATSHITDSILTWLSHCSTSSLPDDLKARGKCVCMWCYRWLQSLIWHLYCLSLWTRVTARRSTCAALRDTDCRPQRPPLLLMSVPLPSTQCLLLKCFLAWIGNAILVMHTC